MFGLLGGWLLFVLGSIILITEGKNSGGSGVLGISMMFSGAAVLIKRDLSEPDDGKTDAKALETLKKRLANGDITEEEFESKKKLLED